MKSLKPIACCVLFVLPFGLRAQSTSAAITGLVDDPARAPVPGAKLTVINTETGARTSFITSDQGAYGVPGLVPGPYRIEVEKLGFKTIIQDGLVLHVQDNVQMNFHMALGSTSESITVESDVNSTDASVSTVIDNHTIAELPINGRDYTRFNLLTPGSTQANGQVAALSFNGMPIRLNEFQIDGVDATRVDFPYVVNGAERGARLLTGSMETIEEFRAQTGSYQPEFGRAAAGYVNIATKSGTNIPHGTLWEYFRNNWLDARNFFNTKPAPQAPFRYHDFGANISGPLHKDKSFFFLNYEGSRQRVGITGTGTVPSALLRSQVLAQSPSLAPILTLFPSGTAPTSNPQIDNYTTVGNLQVREDTGSVKIDHSFSAANTFFARVNINDTHVVGPLLGVISNALGTLDIQDVPIRVTNIAIHDQHVFSPHLINEFLAGIQRVAMNLNNGDQPYPKVAITGLTVSPGTLGHTIQNNNIYQLSDSLSFTTGTHNLKAGMQLYRIQLDRKAVDTTSVNYTSITDFINNSIFSASRAVGNPGTATRGYELAFYAQDSWHLARNLTFNYGLRWDYDVTPFDPANRQQTFDIATNKLARAGTDMFNSNSDYSPRLGLVWQAVKPLTIKAGYGIFYQAFGMGYATQIVTNNFPGNTTLLRSQIPVLSYPITPFLSQGTLALPTVYGFDPNRHDVYTHQYNLTLEYAVTGSTALTVAYVGNHALNLRGVRNINLIDPATGTRPIPGFSNVNIDLDYGQGTYNSLQLNLKQRYSRGLQGSFSYTWSHAIDDVPDSASGSADPQDYNNLRAERGNGNYDIRHVASYELLYDLPMGSGKAFLNGTSALSRLASGWQLSSLGEFRTGVPVTVVLGVNTYGNGDLTNQRPNAVAGVDPYTANPGPDGWLSPSAFSLPARGTFGNLGRNTVFGPGYTQVDMSLIKNTTISDRYRVQFRTEVFNLFNRPNFDLPQATFGTPSFGHILNTFGRTLGAGVSRQIQLSLKLSF